MSPVDILALVRELKKYEPAPYSDRVAKLYAAIVRYDKLAEFHSKSHQWFMRQQNKRHFREQTLGPMNR